MMLFRYASGQTERYTEKLVAKLRLPLGGEVLAGSGPLFLESPTFMPSTYLT